MSLSFRRDDTRMREPARPRRPVRRGAILATLCMIQLINAADVTVLNVALPVLREDLGFQPASLSWVINGYLIAMTATLLVAGRLCDAWGSRRVFVAGIGVFVVAAACCAMAMSPWSLVLARVGQGLGASLATAAELAIIITLYTTAADRARAIALMSTAGILGSSMGLVGGAAMVEWLSWRWVFAVDVGIGITTIVIALSLIPTDTTTSDRPPIRPGSAALAATGLALLATAIVQIDGARLPSWWVVGAAVTGLLCSALFLLIQRRVADPLLPLEILTTRSMLVGGVVLGIASSCLLGQFYIQTQYLQIVLGYDSWTTGLAFLPVNISVSAASLLLAGRLIALIGARRVLTIAMLLLAAGLFLYARQPDADTSYWRDSFAPMLVVGGAGGLATVSATVAALDSTSSSNGGVAAGLVQAMRQGGGVIGIAVLASVTVIVGGTDVSATGLKGAMTVSAALAVVGAFGTLLLPRPPNRPGARGTRDVANADHGLPTGTHRPQDVASTDIVDG